MSFQLLEFVLWGNRIVDYLIALTIVLAGILFIKIVVRKVIQYVKAFAEKTTTTLDDFIVGVVEKIVLPGLYLSCVYLGLKVLALPFGVDQFINGIQLAILTFFLTRGIVMTLAYSLNAFLVQKQEDAMLVRSLEGMMKVVKFVVWALAAIIFLDNIGFKVSTIIAGLGIGGVAVAIAAQALLKDFFSYFSIVFDRPFKIGDFIIIGDFMGTVEHIGIKTTRIRSLGGEQLIFSNTDLTDSRVRNYKLMEKRRVLFRIGVTYQTPLAKLKEIPHIIESIIKAIPQTSFDRAHFVSFGDFSLIFEVVFFVLNPDYNKYTDVQQQINFALKEEFEKRGIEFAYPTQTLYVNTAK